MAKERVIWKVKGTRQFAMLLQLIKAVEVENKNYLILIYLREFANVLFTGSLYYATTTINRSTLCYLE